MLTPQEIEQLFTRLRMLVQEGKTILFISHKLDEVLELSDTITVMRKGRRIDTMPNKNLQRTDLARAMVGRSVVFTVEKSPPTIGRTVLTLASVSTAPINGVALRDVSLHVRAGEIVGIAGVEGNGQLQLAELLTGHTAPIAGTITLNGKTVNSHDSVTRRTALSFVPQDRKHQGSCQSVDLANNSIMTHHRLNDTLSDRRRLFLNRRRCRSFTQTIVDDFQVVCSAVSQTFGLLSGGNQQKIIVGREFMLRNDLILLDQPTRGLDVGSIEYIRGRIIERRDRGGAFVLISADLDELQALADRLLVLVKGRIVGELDPRTTERETIGEYMLGVRSA